MKAKNHGRVTRGSVRTCVLFLFVAICAATEHAQAANLNVNCDKQETINKVLRLLAKTNPQGPNTIFVSGSCKENLVIQSLDRLTLITKTSASISDRSKGTLPVVDIEDSRSVTLQGFTLNGGLGVDCAAASVCYLQANTVQDALGQQGVGVNSSQAFLSGNTIQNNTQRGLTVNLGGQVVSDSDTFHDNGSTAAFANTDALFTGFNCSIVNNGSDGSPAIVATDHSTLRLFSCTISGNKGDGVQLKRASEAQFNGPNSVTANSGLGVIVNDLSFAFFDTFGNNITGNLGGTDVLCTPQFSATRGALTSIGGGTTNCVEPTKEASREKGGQ